MTASCCFPWGTCGQGVKVFMDGGEAAEGGGHRPWDRAGSWVRWELSEKCSES